MNKNETAWPNNYPKEELWNDIDAMIIAFLETLFKHVPKTNVYGVYFKGSAFKKWDSKIDYVPGISDVDIHFLLKNPGKFKRMSFPEAMQFSNDLQKSFASKRKYPAHIPKLQTNLLNDLMKKEFYSSTPALGMLTIYGNDYPHKKINNSKEIDKSRHKIMADAGAYAESFPLRIIDKVGNFEKYLPEISCRVSNSVSNYVFIQTGEYEKVWSMNRTQLARELRALGKNKLADDFVFFYENAWDYYITKSEKSLSKALTLGIIILENVSGEISKKANRRKSDI